MNALIAAAPRATTTAAASPSQLQMRKGKLRVGVGAMDVVSHQSGFQTLELDAR